MLQKGKQLTFAKYVFYSPSAYDFHAAEGKQPRHSLTICSYSPVPTAFMLQRVLDNMSETPTPTRPEATDVANIILDGADGVLLGAETLRGK